MVLLYKLLTLPFVLLNLMVSALIYSIIHRVLVFQRFPLTRDNLYPWFINYWEHILKCIELTYCPFEHTSASRKLVQKKLLPHHRFFYTKHQQQRFFGKIRKEIFKIIPFLPKRFWYDFVGNVIFLYLPFLTLFIFSSFAIGLLCGKKTLLRITAHISPDRYNLSSKMQIRERWFCFYCDLATGLLAYYKEIYRRTI